MTLAELADYVTQKVGQTDSNSVAICKTFIQRRNQMIWDFAIWADAQALITVQSNAVDFSEIDFPESVERVMNLRNVTTASPVQGVSIGTIFDFDSSIFAQTGMEWKFIHLPSGYAPFATGVGHVTFVAEDIFGSDVAVITLYGNNATGVDVSETISVPLTGQVQTTLLNFTGKTGASMDNAGIGRGFIVPVDDAIVLGVYFSLDGISTNPTMLGVTQYLQIVTLAGDDADTLATHVGTFLEPYISPGPVVPGSGTILLTALTIGPMDDITDYDTGIGITIVQGSLGSNTTTLTSFNQLYYLSSELFQPSIPMINEADVGIGAFSGSLFPENAVTERVQRIRCYPARTVQDTYLAHVKLVAPALSSDDDIPQIKGIDNVLLAFAQADMLQRQRQYAKAQALMTEAQGQLQIMLDLEKNQQAFDSCVVPALVNSDQYYDDFFGARGKGWW